MHLFSELFKIKVLFSSSLRLMDSEEATGFKPTTLILSDADVRASDINISRFSFNR